MDNKDLQARYNRMHSQGVSAWFDDGQEERETIVNMGNPWDQLRVLEIGCGEGTLGLRISEKKADYLGIDYSKEAILKAEKIDSALFTYGHYRTGGFGYFDRLVMQGVLEHLDDPFAELRWMIDNLLLEGGDIITSSPCFVNPRGIVWMTLDMLGAVMSKTDLHFLHLWDFWGFAMKYGYHIETQYCNDSWGNDKRMIEDFLQRIPLATRDGNLPHLQPGKLNSFLLWLQQISDFDIKGYGATAIYKIQT